MKQFVIAIAFLLIPSALLAGDTLIGTGHVIFRTMAYMKAHFDGPRIEVPSQGKVFWMEIQGKQHLISKFDTYPTDPDASEITVLGPFDATTPIGTPFKIISRPATSRSD